MGHETTIAGSFELAARQLVASACSGYFQAPPQADQGDELTAAYAANLSHRLPLMYCVVLFDIVVLMASFHATAPAILAFWLPLPFLAMLLTRTAYWLPANVEQRSFDVLKRDLARLPLLGSVVALVPMCWSLVLYGYGSQAQQSLVHYMTAVTCFTGILGLGQSPQTAIRMAAAAMIPSSIFFLIQIHPDRFAVVAVQIVVTFLVLMITAGYHRDFVSLEMSRQELARREKDSAQQAETNLQNAMRDALTGANNRRAILGLLEKQLSDSKSCLPWLALVDLDGFKYINDTYGHGAGDAVLCEVSNRIGEVPEIDAFGRIGGDEFALLIPGKYGVSQVRATLERLTKAIAKPISVDDLRVSVRGSIGLHRCAAGDIGDALERADNALYSAKELRSGAVATFTAADERTMCERRDATRVFTSSDLGQQLALLYQPIIDSDSGRPIAFEALVRWSPDGTKWLSPAAFINLAENTGRIGELTRHVLVKALKECRAWQWDCSLAINLSAHDILRDDAASWIGDIVAHAEAPPNRIILEVTETALISDYRRAANNLANLRQMGFRIALDDFGTGQSSLGHVHNLPLDQIKIDKSFSRELEQSERTRAIVSTILSLARQLRLECTIEGIETLGQQVIARQLGIRSMQGYYFGRPAKAIEVIGGLDAYRSASVA